VPPARRLTPFPKIKDTYPASGESTSRAGESRDNLGYIESNLLPDEQIVYHANLHWKIFLGSSLIVLVGILLLIVQPIAAGIVVLIGLFFGLRAFIDYKSSEFGVTTKRVIIKVGFLRRRTLELLLRQVEAISVEQSVLGRMFGFGSLTLTGTGGVHEVFHNISSPLEFRKRIHGQAT
jgi:uncharacterized membrane protein YdbT with pleckstrin-like domain